MDGAVLSYYILGWLLSVIAILGNGLVVYLIVTRRQLHTSANCFIASLCVADFMVGSALVSTTLCLWYMVTLRQTHYDATALVFPARVDHKHLRHGRGTVLCNSVTLNICQQHDVEASFIFILLSWMIPTVAFLIPFTILYVDKRKVALHDFFIFVVAVMEFLPIVLLMFTTARILLITRRLSRQIEAQVAQVKFNHASQRRTFASKRSNLYRYSGRVIVLVVSLFFLYYTIDIYFIFCETFKACTFHQRCATQSTCSS